MAETEEVDRISNLPDALLSEILSLLSTKEAVATSILSKRWEYIWTEVPVLDFSYSKDKLSSNFTTFVNRVLILNDAPVIRLFRLNLYQEDDEEIEDMHVWSWIRNTMRRDVLEIDVICGTPEARGLVSEKLKVLKLRCPLKGSRLLYSFPILSILHLEFCYIEDHDSMNNIWSGLPCLNEFLLYHCHGLQNLRIQSSSLKRLTVAGTLFRMEGLVIIEAPSLEYISIEDQVYCCEFDINIPSLVEADIDICGMIDGISAAEFLKHFHSMKTLNLMIPTPLVNILYIMLICRPFFCNSREFFISLFFFFLNIHICDQHFSMFSEV
ncbi:FBD-associated F-box protein At5g56370-like [Chenopodium quinoa]|uniref:FBD-associated F-box protein At5g56370-like n=1 Tax=Chenopodium quinoa TaxID=63459 RepID=UPI000B79ABE6|nr:FBD-associated F-box protein At5g56370-like [Chenopodium quinoa]